MAHAGTWEGVSPADFADATLETETDSSTAVEGALFERVQTPRGAKMMPCGMLMQATRGDDWTHYQTYLPALVGQQYAPTLLSSKVTVGDTVLVAQSTRLLRLVSSG
jgi:hypothetical protein